MRARSLILVLLLVVGAWLPGAGCGGTASPVGGARPGPFVFGLPFLPAGPGQSVFVGLKNVFNVAATVFVSAFTPAGVAYNVDGKPGLAGIQPLGLVVPANGELRVSLGSILGGAPAGGWLCVETRDVYARHPVTGQPGVVPHSGFVFPYIHRQTSGAAVDGDSFVGVTGQATGVTVAVKPETDTIQLLNYSFNEVAGGPVMPIPVTFSVTTFSTAGVLVNTAAVPVPANGTVNFAPFLPTGSVRIEPMAPLPAPPALPQLQLIRYAAVAQENGLQLHAEHRFHETSLAHLAGQIDFGFEVSFGLAPAGNSHDFELLLSNPTGTNQTLLLQGVHQRGGAPLLTAPRAFQLNAGRTVLMRTQTVDSIGLLPGEQSLFDDIFGDVFAGGGFDEVTLWLQVPAPLDVSARQYDPAFGSFYRVVRALPRSSLPCVFDLPIQDTLLTGTRNVISITNTSNGPLRVPVQGYTPGGTLYLLEPLTIAAGQRLDWTPDGQVFREVPTDPTLPAVPFMRFQFSPPSGAFFRGCTTVTDALGLINFLTPHAQRDN